MEEEKYWLLLGRHLSGELSQEETEELQKWIVEHPEKAHLLQQVERDWNQAAVYANEEVFDTNIAWDKLQAKMDRPPAKVRRLFVLEWLKVAAVLLIALFASLWGYRYYDAHRDITIVNDQLAAKQYSLPDGSSIWLKQGSSLRYEKGMASLSERTILLKGEAFFEVKHKASSPFIISTSKTTTRVLGTSFNVKQEGSEVIVSVMSGKVSFKGGSDALILLPGERASFSETKGMLKTRFGDMNFMYWKNGVLNFENEPLEKVLAALAEVYDVQFRIENNTLAKQRVTTTLGQRPFAEIKTLLELLLDAKIEKRENVYVVK